MADLRNSNEVFIGDTYFRTLGPVRLTNITVTPNPVVFGDTTRAGDTQVMSQFVQPHTLGGSGIYRGSVRTDFDRHWKSRAETRWRYITLPPAYIDAAKPAGVGSSVDANIIHEFNGTFFAAWGPDIYAWNGGSSWSALEVSCSATPTDAQNWSNAMFVADTQNIRKRTNAGVWSVANVLDAYYLTVFDAKLWALCNVAGVWTLEFSSNAAGTTYTASAIYVGDGTPTGLFTYRDAAGDQRLYLATDRGLWILDQTNAKWLQTDMRFPPAQDAGKNSFVFRDANLYVKGGGVSIYQVAVGTTTAITPVGLDRDDALPSEDFGQIVSIAGDYNWLWALIDGSTLVTTVDDAEFGDMFGAGSWVDQVGSSTLRAWNGGWHCPWESPNSGAPAVSLCVSVGTDNKLRVLCGVDRRVYVIEVPYGIYNARSNPTWLYAQGPISHVTPWWDLSSEAQDKLVAHILLNVVSASATEKVDVYVGKDLSETWEFLGSITSPGLTTVKLDSGRGENAKLWRVRFDLSRGSDNTKAPRIEYNAVEFMRLLPATYGFALNLDMTQTHRNKTPAQQIAALKRLSDPRQTPKLIEFSYQDDLSGDLQTYLTKITRVLGQEYSGTDLRGMGNYLVSVVAPYTEDTL